MTILGVTFPEFALAFKNRHGRSMQAAATVYRCFFRPDLSGRLRHPLPECGIEELSRQKDFYPLILEKRIQQHGVIKFVFRLKDGMLIETVLIPMVTHQTLCISTQVGCRMGCVFCETAQSGFKRHLAADEITAQVFHVRALLNESIRNVVLMGMGEPLDNPENVFQAIRVLTDARGFDIAHRHITLSTVGLAEGIQKLGEHGWPNLCLAISLNAPNDIIRSRIMPINKTYSMTMLHDRLRDYPLKKDGVFFIEYVLIRNVNDARHHARELAEYLRSLPVRVNLIKYNPRQNSPFSAPAHSEWLQFRDWLIEERLFVRLRSPKGDDIQAGCGQLGRTNNNLVKPF